MHAQPLLYSDVPGVPVRRGKVRDIYDFGDRLLFVATDRISAFDWVLPNGIPDKGRVLTGLSEMWFRRLHTTHHLLGMDPDDLPLPAETDRAALRGRSMVVRKTQVVPIECVVRGYLAGSGWKEYRRHGTVCGLRLPEGLRDGDRLEEPIFTPATKVDDGHDENIPFGRMCELIGEDLSVRLKDLSLDLYRKGAEYALTKGIIIADTKFEFGRTIGEAGSKPQAPELATRNSEPGTLLLIDEVLTPDSSRFWPVDEYEPGRPQPSFDKQFVRDWLETTGWDKQSPPPPLPDDVAAKTREKYVEAYRRLVGREFPEQ